MGALIYMADVLPLGDRQTFDRLLEQVPEYRRRKVCAYRFEKDRMLSLGAGLLLKKALASRGIAEDSTVYGENGKPYLSAHPDVHYSLSHSERMVMCAVSAYEIGCDIEKTDASLHPLADYILSPEEQRLFYSLANEKEQNNLLFRLWVLKESYLKATGKGLSEDPTSLSFFLDGAPRLSGAENYCFFELNCPEGYRAACCVRDCGSIPEQLFLESVSKRDICRFE